MKAPTHIIGGLVFGGTLCSFSDVNIFENHYYVAACVGFSLLPDIDTTKSAIGKIFYPFAWILYRKFGHRTITHSLLFLALVWLIFIVLSKFGIIQDPNYIKIALFSVLGHFVFDMLTISGVPLLYPFFQNKCVIPGNKEFRFNTNEWKSEIVVAGICGLLCITMQPLFANGFWTSYNRTFGTIKHVDRENQNTEFYVICEYSYILNAQTHEGEAIVITSNTNELVLFDGEKMFKLNSTDPQLKVNHAKPRISDIEKRFKEMVFFNISLDSLQNILNGKIASGLVQSNHNVRYIEDAITYYTNFIRFTNRFDKRIYAGIDSVRLNIRTSIARLEASINQAYQRHNSDMQRYRDFQNSIVTLEDSLKSPNLSNYERNRLQQELISLRRRNMEMPVFNPPAAQIAELDAQRRAISERSLMFSGHVTVLTFGYQLADANLETNTSPNQPQPNNTIPDDAAPIPTPIPNFDAQVLLARSDFKTP